MTYSFHIEKKYENCILICYCCEDDALWLFPQNTIKEQLKLSIGYHKSKYNIHKVEYECVNIISKLNELYNLTTQYKFEELNIPICIWQQREQIFRKYREEKIDFIKFDYENMECTVYDFKINGSKKVQEKVCAKNPNNSYYVFNLCKNNGIVKNKSNFIQYDIGDNDIYWINCADYSYFFVIPEKILVEKDIIGNNSSKKNFKVNPNKFSKKTEWLRPYVFHYDNIDKNKLLDILGIGTGTV